MPKRTDAQRPGEFELIARYFAPLSGEGAFGLIDDAALVSVTPGKALAMTQDAIMAGVHFLPDDPPNLIAAKALRVNLSDLAAKGATPAAFSLSLGLHDGWDEAWIAAFAGGLASDCASYGLSLSGGDTFRAPGGPVISITAWGEIDPAAYKSRLGARPGDLLFVTGTIGDGAIGLKVRLGEAGYRDLPAAPILLSLYLAPRPPVRFAPLIAQFASASMDISDGFVGDLRKMALASGVSMEVHAGNLPFSPQVREALALPGAMVAALTGGDDYQILFTVSPARLEAFREAAALQDVTVTQIGHVVPSDAQSPIFIRELKGVDVTASAGSYSHF